MLPGADPGIDPCSRAPGRELAQASVGESVAILDLRSGESGSETPSETVPAEKPPEFDAIRAAIGKLRRPLRGASYCAEEQAVQQIVLSEDAPEIDPAAVEGGGARIEHDAALGEVVTELMQDDAEFFRQFSDNDSFRDWLARRIFELTSRGKNAA